MQGGALVTVLAMRIMLGDEGQEHDHRDTEPKEGAPHATVAPNHPLLVLLLMGQCSAELQKADIFGSDGGHLNLLLASLEDAHNSAETEGGCEGVNPQWA